MNDPRPSKPKRRWYQFSLRTLLLFVTLFAIGCAALVNASSTWLQVVSTATLAILLISTIMAVFDHGQRRVFAGGFVICGIGYLALVHFVIKNENTGMGRIGTTTALSYLHLSISREVPNPPSRTMTVAMHHYYFMQIGQQFWALLIGWLGGLLACYVHRRPAAE